MSAPFKLFISYARQDVAQAERLEAMLSGAPHGFQVWRDKRRLRPGEHVDFVIADALRDSDAVVVLWSETAADSDWVRHEASYAVVEGKVATLAVGGFDYAKLSSVYRPLNCGDLDAILADPAPLLERLAAIVEARKPPPPKLIDTYQLPRAANAFIARAEELSLLRRAWIEEKPNVLALIAAGGTGKTALAQAFLDEMAQAGWLGAEAVYAFSFDSQGTDDKRQGSSDRFFSEALTFFGEKPEEFDSVRERANRLTEILERTRALLILDGIEPMQSARGDGEHGRLRDDAMSDFLIRLARDNTGLCLVTTRLPLPDLRAHKPEQVRQLRLPNLPLEDAVALLKVFGVSAPDQELQALARDYGQEISEGGAVEIRCHAKAIALIGGFIARRFAGVGHVPRPAEIRDAFAMPAEAFLGVADEALKQAPGYAVYKMTRRYEILYQQRAARDPGPARQLALLRIMGLFDRPAPWAAVKAVLAAPEISGLTEGLGAVSPGDWREAVSALRADGLLNPAPDGVAALEDGRLIDAHPLIREYFGRRLEATERDAFRKAHGRLYDFYRFRGLPEAFREPVANALLGDQVAFPNYGARRTIDDLLSGRMSEASRANTAAALRDASPDALRAAAALIDGPEWKTALETFLPEDEAGMTPLFAAIAHGCAAGRHDEAFNEVYWPRVARGAEAFATKKLGLYGSDLSALAHFFAEPFATPAPGLTPARQALVLNEAGFRLRALGRLAEAVEPMRTDLSMAEEQQDWEGAAISASNLSELLATLGRLDDAPAGGEAGAVATAAQAVAFADRSGDAFSCMVNRATHADALLQAGAWGAARSRFEEAEALQRDRQPALPLLYSLPGYQWCDLKLAQGRGREVTERAEYALPLTDSLLDISLNTLSLGRSAHQAARDAAGSALAAEALRAAAAPLDAAVAGLRAAGSNHHLPRGLLARAAWRRDAGAAALAAKDLSEALDIAERGGMRLHLADGRLESARQSLARPEPNGADLAAARTALAAAEALVAAAGYRRREPDLALLRAELALARGDAAGARPHLDALIATIRAHDLWSFLPDLARLTERPGLAGLAPTLAELRAERARFDQAADAAFETARQPGSKASPTDPTAIPDELVDQMLGDERFRALVDGLHEQTGQPKLADLDADAQRTAARAVMAAIIAAKAGDQDKPPPEQPATETPPAAEPDNERSAGKQRWIDRLLRRKGA